MNSRPLPGRALSAGAGLPRILALWPLMALLLLLPTGLAAQNGQEGAACMNTVYADVVAHDEVIFYNRWGAFDPGGMMFSLMEDLVPMDPALPMGPGNAKVAPGKRPRPLVLRVNEGDCLDITFTNWLAPMRVNEVQPLTRDAGIHVIGMQLVQAMQDDGSFVGLNEPSSLYAPGLGGTYKLYAERQGTFFLYSTAANTGGLGMGGTIARGLWGAVNVQPAGAEWYRSQLTNSDLQLATAVDGAGNKRFTEGGHPVIDYEAVYPAGHPQADRPIIRILDDQNQIRHSDLNAIITGKYRGDFAAGTFPPVSAVEDRNRPYREMTVMFHEAFGIVQAFPQFLDPVFGPTIEEGFDGFGINYVAMGVAATVLANRLGVGPAADCPECMFEEFFLSSWAIGDPGLIPDRFANENFDPVTGELLDEVVPATQARFAADPANVFHAYLNDRVVIRNLHAGPTEHHIFHLHAHQWLRHPNSADSEYLDSQAIGPGHGFTYELTFSGAGNRNRTPGDAILHCHFYPHFASGMWGLLRSHDVFEEGTKLLETPDGVELAAGARALPDGELGGEAKVGGLIPAVVPIPGQPLPVMPGDPEAGGFPGYPFYIPGQAGHRPPQPPLDMAFDGGLPRHVVVAGEAVAQPLNRLDFTKDMIRLDVDWLPQDGTEVEKTAMDFHWAGVEVGGVAVNGGRGWPTWALDPMGGAPTAAFFQVNGLPPAPGAPYADPCTTAQGDPVAINRRYKGAAIQLGVKYNKAGWHFPQHRMYSLWDDVNSYLEGQRAPEPLFMRTNTGDCIEFHFKNLVPHIYERDDFQVRTPTDVMGQHIHLVKFDVTSSDGGGNGWNYEDGSLSSGDVQHRIAAINAANECVGEACLAAKAMDDPRFAAAGDLAVGAQVTIQRWYTDDVLNYSDGGALGGIFTHDHFAPSTHQQAGLYGALLHQPRNSRWYHSETGVELGTRPDGGPTSWQAVIVPQNNAGAYREFALMMQDFALAYDETHPEGHIGPNPFAAINPPGKVEGDVGQLLLPPWVHNLCPNEIDPAVADPNDPTAGGDGCPELFSADNVGMWTVNYRAEPVALRVRDPFENTQPLGDRADLSLAFQSRTDRPDQRFNEQPNFYPPLTGGVGSGDPFTPLMRAYMGDRIRIRLLVGAHEESHHFSMHGARWLAESGNPNSGWKNGQLMGISEKFEVVVPPVVGQVAGNQVDYMWQAGTAVESIWSGTWGILRSYGQRQNQVPLRELESNPRAGGNRFGRVANANQFNEACPITAPVRVFKLSAWRAADILPGGTLMYNQRMGLEDPTAVLYVRDEDVIEDELGARLRDGVPIEPLILRAAAGECIDVRLTNRLPEIVPDLDGWSTLPMIVFDHRFPANEAHFNSNSVRPSSRVGLRPQLVSYDPSRSEGAAVGNNPNQTVAPALEEIIDPITGEVTRPAQAAESKRYLWYAGLLDWDRATETLTATPAELGAVNLLSSDRIKHSQKGTVGALIIQPQGSSWITDDERADGCGGEGMVPCSRASATVIRADGSRFREFVVVFQDDISLHWRGPNGEGELEALPNIAGAHDPEDAGHKAINYRIEPLWTRAIAVAGPNAGNIAAPDEDEAARNDFYIYTDVHASSVFGDPETPIFYARAGEEVRFRLLHPGGVSRSVAFNLHGHGGLERPWKEGSNSTELGDNSDSQWQGITFGIGPASHENLLVTHGAGGLFKVEGDYLYRSQMSGSYDQGMWGIFRVGELLGGVEGPGENGVAQVVVSPASAAIGVGQTVQLTATVLNAAGDEIGNPVTWASSNVSIATVNQNGLVTGVSIGGPIEITATAVGPGDTTATGSSSVRICTLNPGGRCRAF
jgi:manganese oxidase